jgi:hypothetical protein
VRIALGLIHDSFKDVLFLMRGRIISRSYVEKAIARYFMRLIYLRLKFALFKYPGPREC